VRWNVDGGYPDRYENADRKRDRRCGGMLEKHEREHPVDRNEQHDASPKDLGFEAREPAVLEDVIEAVSDLSSR
jgi:hypothetical protein